FFNIRLTDREDWNREPWEIDRKNASLVVGQVARMDAPVIRFDAPMAEGEPKAETGAIGASLLKWVEELVDAPARQTAAFILDLHQHTLGARADSQRDRRMRPGEFKGVLQEVGHHRRKNLA